jgi:hypothetical protein
MDEKKWPLWTHVKRFVGLNFLILAPFFWAWGKNDQKVQDLDFTKDCNIRVNPPARQKGTITDKGAWRVQRSLVLYKSLKYDASQHLPNRVLKVVFLTLSLLSL